MKYFSFFMIVFGCFLFACQSDFREDPAITPYRKAFQENPTSENRQALIAAYRQAMTRVEDQAVLQEYQRQIAEVQMDNNAYPQAIATLMTAIRTAKGQEGVEPTILMLADIYEKPVDNPTVAGIIKKIHALAFPNNAETANVEEISEEISSLGGSMYNEVTHQVDYTIANDYILVCELQGLLDPNPEEGAAFLHKAGETARSIRDFPKAITLYNLILERYPDYEKASQALFLKAFILDNNMGKKQEARGLYELFLEKYPADDFADDTRFLLANIDKNDEEIIESFKKEE